MKRGTPIIAGVAVFCIIMTGASLSCVHEINNKCDGKEYGWTTALAMCSAFVFPAFLAYIAGLMNREEA